MTRRFNSKWKAFALFWFLALFGIVACVGVLYKKAVYQSSAKLRYYNGTSHSDTIDGAVCTQDVEGDVVCVLFQSIEFNVFTGRLTTYMFVAPIGELANYERRIVGFIPNTPLRLIVDDNTYDYPANISVMPRRKTFILEGNPIKYPFDHYERTVNISAFVNPTNESQGTAIQIIAYGLGNLPSISTDWNFSDPPDDDSFQTSMTFTLERNNVVKAFSILTLTAMWVIGGSILTLASSIWWRKMQIEPPVMQVGTGFLLALPGVRNSQPGIPTIAGTIGDMTCFFFALAITMIAATMLQWRYIVTTKVPDKVYSQNHHDNRLQAVMRRIAHRIANTCKITYRRVFTSKNT